MSSKMDSSSQEVSRQMITGTESILTYQAFVGGMLAVTAGWMCDQTARIMARANKGTFEPEFRILVNILAAVILGIGWFVFMWDVNHPTPHGYYLGAFCHACITFGITITSTTGGLYIL